jgi:thiamine phosphate synthase YjbQ (UPF0047 family)
MFRNKVKLDLTTHLLRGLLATSMELPLGRVLVELGKWGMVGLVVEIEASLQV